MRWFIAAFISFALTSTVLSKELEFQEPTLEILVRASIYNVGERKAIFCRGINTVEPIKWYSPSGEEVKNQSHSNSRVYAAHITPKDAVGINLVLMIQHITVADTGKWTCKSGDLEQSIDFVVGEKVNIGVRNVEKEGEESKSIKLDCEAKGHPSPVVVWYKENERIPNDSKKYTITSNNALEIKKLTHADVGTYVCKVRQKALSYYTDKTVHLTVLHKPVLHGYEDSTSKYKTEEIYAIVNETKNITCSAIANPAPTYTWYRRRNGYDGDPIIDEDSVVTSENGSYSVLILRMRDESVFGEYKCAVSNNKGKESIVFHVNPAAKPSIPDYINLVNASYTWLTFNVTCSMCPIEQLDENSSPDPNNLPITGYSFLLVPAREDYPADWDSGEEFDVDIQDPDNTCFNVEPLANSTKYHVRVRSRNAAGYSDWLDYQFLAETSGATKILFTFMVIISTIIAVCF